MGLSYLWGFQRLKRTREMYFGKVYGGVLHSLQLRSKCCIQFIVRPHPRIAFKSPNIRLEWPFYAKKEFFWWDCVPCWEMSENSKCTFRAWHHLGSAGNIGEDNLHLNVN